MADSTPQDGHRRKALVVAAGGGFTVQVANLVRQCPGDVDVLIVGPAEVEPRLRRDLPERAFVFRPLPLKWRQHRHQTLLGSLPSLFLGTASAVCMVRQERPHVVIGIGQRAAVYFLIAAWFFRVRSIFIECITRVTRPSKTARLICRLRLADRVYVQWPEVARALPGSLFRGRLI